MSPIIEAAKHFIGRVTEGDPPTPTELIILLDDLARSYHACPDGNVQDDKFDPPALNGPETYGLIASRFPALGMYATSDPTVVVNDEPLVADAIDDLADIVGDLRDVIATHDAVSPDDGYWLFRWTYRSHWGDHLRRLTFYLHANHVWD
jgi:hypothetical protein